MVNTKNPLVNKILNNLKLGDLRAKRSGVNLVECKKRSFIKSDISFKKNCVCGQYFYFRLCKFVSWIKNRVPVDGGQIIISIPGWNTRHNVSF